MRSSINEYLEQLDDRAAAEQASVARRLYGDDDKALVRSILYSYLDWEIGRRKEPADD